MRGFWLQLVPAWAFCVLGRPPMATRPAQPDNDCSSCQRILAELEKTNGQFNILLRALLDTIDASPRWKDSGPAIDDEKVAAFVQSIGGRWAGSGSGHESETPKNESE